MREANMANRIRIGLAQINSTVGALKRNMERCIDYIQDGYKLGVDVLVFPELAITGYPPEDLLRKPEFIEDNIKTLKELSIAVPAMAVIAGFVDKKEDMLYNAAAIIYDGGIKGVYHKRVVPYYGAFDEARYFKAGGEPPLFKYGDMRFSVNIGEDIRSIEGPAMWHSIEGADVIFNIDASPYYMGKGELYKEMIRNKAKINGVIISYTNMVGGQDGLVFDGGSLVVDQYGNIIAIAQPFKEDLLVVDVERGSSPGDRVMASRAGGPPMVITVIDQVPMRKRPDISRPLYKPLDPVAEVYEALLLGLHDYVEKNGFQKVVLGLSGGIDSALVAVIAYDALGKESVVGVFMPSPYTSKESLEDATQLAQNLGIGFYDIPISEIFNAYLTTLRPFFKDKKEDETEENIQARIRGNILMAISNKFGWLVLTGGNKSEMSVGYTTLYGDMAGGFAVIGDVPKTLVYELVRYRNRKGELIPSRIITKEPTAELKPGQKDSDSLPPYEIIDAIIEAYVEEDRHQEEIINQIKDRETVIKVLRMVDRSEYKRRQAPHSIKISHKAFGKGERMPITNRYRG
jgi:NAD+ synthase (glutamine-hydrolysing)